MKRAQAAGVLRADFSPHDLPLFQLANAGAIAGTGATAERASPRVVAYLLAACHTHQRALPPIQAFRGLTKRAVFAPEDLVDVRERIIRPVVESLVSFEELLSLAFGRGAQHAIQWGHGKESDLYVEVTAIAAGIT